MTKKFHRIAIWVLCAGGCILLQRFCHKQTDGFSLYKISSSLGFHPEWEVPPLNQQGEEELSRALSQPYRYLAKGAQSYVFLSEDGNYVIKFFRIYHLQPPWWVTHLQFPWILQSYRAKKIEQKTQELQKDFMSYKIAYDQMQEETGLVYLHLNKTQVLQKALTIYDKIGIKYQIPLDQMEFLVQKRAELVYPALAQMVENEGLESARVALTRLVDLLCLRCQKGIRDKDPDLNTNFGFLGYTPLQIDVGRFRIEGDTQSHMVDRDEIIRITDNLSQWLRAHYPDLASHLEQTILRLPKKNEKCQGGALNLSQAQPAPKQLNLNKLSDAGGSQIQWLPTPADSLFLGRSSI